MTIEWINVIILNVSGIFCWYFYILSVMPITRAEKYGEKAWKECARLRLIAGLLMFVMVINMILWFWFPIAELVWPVYPNPLVSILIGIVLAMIFTPIVIKGVRDAGKETMQPSETTELYGGIYRYIRHPQTLGEMPWWIIIPIFLNSLFLAIWALIMVIIVTPIMIYYEEKDLVKRFGDAYREYQQNTGALIPKFWKRKEKN